MIKNIDYVCYEDTDSLYIELNQWFKNNMKNPEKWIKLSDEQKIEYIKKISKAIENYVNDKVYNHLQSVIYNSTEDKFKISYEPEKIIKAGLFIKKKKYAFYTVWEEGSYKDKVGAKGLEIIRSDTPVMFKKALTEILEMILKGFSDEEINEKTNEYVKEAKKLPPNDLSSNIGINNLKKYITKENIAKKGAPWHLKGTANYQKLLKTLDLENKYPEIHEGVKAKVIYIKHNPYNIDCITFQKWPEEFNKMGIVPDYDKMIDKFFIKKVKYLLEPINKAEILNNNKKNLNLFFN